MKEKESSSEKKRDMDAQKKEIKTALRNIRIGVTARGRVVTNLDHREINAFLKKKMEEEEE